MPPRKYWLFAMHLLDQADHSESQTLRLHLRCWIPCHTSETSTARLIRNLALSCWVQVLRLLYPALQTFPSSSQQDTLHAALMGFI